MKKKYTIWYDAPEVKEVVVYNEADAIKAFDNAPTHTMKKIIFTVEMPTSTLLTAMIQE